jgi:hypothetical protein
MVVMSGATYRPAPGWPTHVVMAFSISAAL